MERELCRSKVDTAFYIRFQLFLLVLSRFHYVGRNPQARLHIQSSTTWRRSEA
jgi:hypothetical protein